MKQTKAYLLAACEFLYPEVPDEIHQGFVSVGEAIPDYGSPDDEQTIFHLFPEDLKKGFPFHAGEVIIKSVTLPDEKPEKKPDPLAIAIDGNYARIEDSNYIFLPDGNVARLLTPCVVKGREYFNLKYSGKIRRVSRRWLIAITSKKS